MGAAVTAGRDSKRAEAWAAFLATLGPGELVAWDLWQQTHEPPAWPWWPRDPAVRPEPGDRWLVDCTLVGASTAEYCYASANSRFMLNRHGVCSFSVPKSGWTEWCRERTLILQRLEYPPGWAECLAAARGER